MATSQSLESSPSPEPTYDAKGVRINTREWRLREKLQSERVNIIQQIIKLDSNYVPPSDYKAPKVTHKILMPVEEYPDYNFFGLIVGPRGNTQKEMSLDSLVCPYSPKSERASSVLGSARGVFRYRYRYM